jgi:hypothetical protein
VAARHRVDAGGGLVGLVEFADDAARVVEVALAA